jgi:hypothetical protein
MSIPILMDLFQRWNKGTGLAFASRRRILYGGAMDDGLIVPKTMGELRRAAIEGRAYYSCETFKDAYGRLIVGVGARLEGRALKVVTHSGRKTVYVSPMALCDGVGFPQVFEESEPSSADETLPGGIEGLFQAVAKVHPEAASRLVALNPQPHDLEHGMAVGVYVRRLMTAYNAIRREGAFAYSRKDQMSGFVAGVVHDIGRWSGRPDCEHTTRGACLLRELITGSAWIGELSDVVAHHHTPLCHLLNNRQFFKIAPVMLAEAVTEGLTDPAQMIHDLFAETLPEMAKNLFVGLCNIEGCMPPLTVVRFQNREMRTRRDLAVSLRCEKGDDAGPYLLRFAQLDIRGRPRPVQLANRCLIGPGHPDYEGSGAVVIDVLATDIYERMFKAFEGLIPVYQKVMGY